LKRPLIAAAALAAVVIAAPAGAQIIPFLGAPLPVIDAQGETTWLRELAQELAQGVSLKNILTIQEHNIIPTPFGWPLGSHGPLNAQPILIAAEAQIAAAAAQVQANTGKPPAPNQATILAQTGVEQIPADTADIDAVKVCSDNAEGDLSAQQCGHRVQTIQVEQQQKALQLAYAQQLQKASDDATTLAWATSPLPITTMGADAPAAVAVAP
jgi:hypothetical protein